MRSAKQVIDEGKKTLLLCKLNELKKVSGELATLLDGDTFNDNLEYCPKSLYSLDEVLADIQAIRLKP